MSHAQIILGCGRREGRQADPFRSLRPLAAFFHGVSQDRQSDALYMETVPDAVTPMMTGTIGFVVQSFLTVRASRVS